MIYSFLIDITKCIGCRACQVSCKRWNQRSALNTTVTQTWTNPPDLSADTFTLIKFVENGEGDDFQWRFVKMQCMHCLDPSCVSACIVQALRKTEEGPVVGNEERCVGCRYCMIACPFSIPKFEWKNERAVIRKCNFCNDRLAEGLQPACSQACPTGAIKFGDRDELLLEAKTRIANGNYFDHIYGEHEVGGTSILFISDTPFEKLGFAQVGTEPLSEVSQQQWFSGVPLVLLTGTTLLGSLYMYKNRREEILQAHKKKNEDVKK